MLSDLEELQDFDVGRLTRGLTIPVLVAKEHFAWRVSGGEEEA